MAEALGKNEDLSTKTIPEDTFVEYSLSTGGKFGNKPMKFVAGTHLA
ncbi:MAG: hypothetical protein ACI9KE_005794 [Polyangiales bacterium]